MRFIEAAEQCTKCDMLAWVHYPYNGTSCYVYPRYLFNGEQWVRIGEAAFPNAGAFQGIITSGDMPKELEEQYGRFVVARINRDDFEENYYYDADRNDSNLYRVGINPSFNKGASDLEFTRFSKTSYSGELVQLVSIRDTVSFLKPLHGSVRLSEGDDFLVAKTILVRCENRDSTTYFGPFEYDKHDDEITLKALSANDFRVARIGISGDLAMTIPDTGDGTAIRLVDGKLVKNLLNELSTSERIDWMPNDELIDLLGRIMNASNKLCTFSKTQKSDLKTVIRDESELMARYEIDDLRKKRLLDMLQQSEDLAELPNELAQGLLNQIDDNRLAKIILAEDNFNTVKDKLIGLSGVEDKIRRENTKLEVSTRKAREARDVAIRERQQAEKELKEAQEEAKKAQELVEQMREDALDARRAEIEELENKIAKLKEESKLESEVLARFRDDKKEIEKSIDRIMAGLNDDLATSTSILESEMLKKVVAAVNGVELRKEDEEEQSLGFVAIREDEDDLSDEEIVDILSVSITGRAGRQMERNDVINLMICLAQGYITTFSGLPGTGKTSLANILGGALGLRNKSGKPRFTEINVENGWTSHKDYIGYYNPLTKTHERSNATVYEAMKRLSNESSDLENMPPYLFLLDEANLSPIEHYWAPFLRACDTFETDGTLLALGGEENWLLPNQMRFLATVNYDHTTEALSHRFLDRSWVVTLDPSFLDTSEQTVGIAKEFEDERAFSMLRLKRAFYAQESDEIDPENMVMLDKLLRICRSNSLSVSPRSQLMMRNYMAAASRLMDIQPKDSAYSPVDFAFSQKVLPQITGTADMVGELVDLLLKESDQLSITKKQLVKMKKYGDDSGFYQYFI